MKLILASASPRRTKILKEAGYVFEVIPSTFEEVDDPTLTPTQLAIKNALGKAQDVASSSENAIVLGADTIVVCKGQILEKPKDSDDAYRMLSLLSGHKHTVLTGYALIRTSDTKQISNVESSTVHFKTLSDKDIEDYIATGDPMDKAGAYGIQSGARDFVDKIEGDINTIVGLPLDSLRPHLRSLMHG